jgi:hypothetical protein
MPQPVSLGKFMLITKKLESKPHGGRELLCRLNHDILLEIFRDQLLLVELQVTRTNNFKVLINAFRGQVDGVDSGSISEIMNKIKRCGVTQAFVDGSNLGGVVPFIKSHYPKIRVTTFFHNVEARFFWGSLLQEEVFGRWQY